LESLEKGKMKRREALTRILNSISEVSLDIKKKIDTKNNYLG
jgi:hypothetical protein